MRRLDVLFTMDCETIQEFAAEGGPRDWELCKKAMGGYCEALLKRELKPTLFVVPQTAQKTASFLLAMENRQQISSPAARLFSPAFPAPAGN